MSTIKADNFTWKSGESSGQAQYTVTADKIISGTAKSWMNMNGSSGAVVRGSFNVSSVTRSSAGQYSMTFTTSMIDANYCAMCGAEYDGNSFGSYGKNLTSSSVGTIQSIGPALTTYWDKTFIYVSVNR